MFEYQTNPFQNENENLNLYNPQRQVLKGKQQINIRKKAVLKTSKSFNYSKQISSKNSQGTRQRTVLGRVNANQKKNVNQNNKNSKTHKLTKNGNITLKNNQRQNGQKKVLLKRSVSQRVVSQRENSSKMMKNKERLQKKNITVKINQGENKKKNPESQKLSSFKIKKDSITGRRVVKGLYNKKKIIQKKQRKVKKKKKIYNIDRPYIKNSQYVTEFVQDIYSNQKKKEIEQMTPVDFLSIQRKVDENMRGILFDWFSEVHLKFKLKTEVLYLTCKIVDKFLEKKNIPVSKLQLAGITAMLIASKYEEIYPPEVDDFVYVTNNSYTREEILKMESVILNVLNFRVTFASPYFFIQRYIKAAGVGMKMAQYLKLKLLSNYLLELTLPRINMIKYRPSQLASAAVYLALVTLKTDPKTKLTSTMKSLFWSDTLQYYTEYKLSDILKCVRDLWKISVQVGSTDLEDKTELLTPRRKYKKKRFARVSLISIRKI
ncbi:cyclin-a2-4 [Anaeramoeba flamelloides]|uniref:Cyclin-a2-4 n=1 Tax=Anaeramoeba flamelloides TaxID=1746091 RepID=A0AAV7YXE2_9EUKA|nr:cyclin-a2-4 [Anaeramoeba flamelloides]